MTKFKNKTLLVTGGTGTFGQAFVKYFIRNFKDIKKIIIFSRDELKQYEMSKNFSEKENLKLRYFIGDVRDKDRIKMALDGVDIVIHSAALKQVPTAEYNPFEFIKTNILGAQNIVESCMDSNVEKVIALSTDKAAGPINLYGATKLCSDKLFVAANNLVGKRKLIYSVVRYGNVLGSRGSILPTFLKQSKNKKMHITDKQMTRFNISIIDAVKMVKWALYKAHGGEIFVQKLLSYKLVDFVKAINPNCKIIETGLRPGEKIHEEMITQSDSYNTFDLGKYYAIVMPSTHNSYTKYKKNKNIKNFEIGNSLNSGKNKFLTINQIKKLIHNN